MGWLDDGFKNVLKGTKSFLKSDAGLAALAIAAPWAMGAMAPAAGGTGFMSGLLAKYPALGSPIVTNAAKNAAMNYGIATLTGSEHPEKAALWAAASSVPFSMGKANTMAKTFNTNNSLTGKDKLSMFDVALNRKNVMNTGFNIPGKITEGAMGNVYDTETFSRMGNTPAALQGVPMQGPGIPIQGATRNMTIDPMQYFTKDVSPKMLDKMASNPGLAGLLPGLGLENMDMMASIVPQIAGLYGGRMSDEEKWAAFKEKQIRMMAFQYGIPYELAKEKFKDGYSNPYYTTDSAGDYGDVQFNKGGSPAYKDSYIAGGKAVGPGTGKSDDIRPVALSNNEFVFTEEASNNFPGGHAGLYSLMNSLDPASETIEEARVQV
jgi:hypothetical protein